MAKIIKSKNDYEAALSEIEKLMQQDPAAGTPGADELELLVLLVQDYEAKEFPIDTPDPIEAIEFRMEQQGLRQKDLVPYIGSRSKVSEVLSRKRSLTLSMIRALHSGLDIPAHVLLQDEDISLIRKTSIEWKRFPLREMILRGWIEKKTANVKNCEEDIARSFFAELGHCEDLVAFPRMTRGHKRTTRRMDPYALFAWTARILITARHSPPSAVYIPENVDLEFMRKVARLSWSESGPLLAQEFLRNNGISLIIESHLPSTYLDGAAILDNSKRPVIGLTLRYDRIDNFWFCLMHELAHVSLHLQEGSTEFYDDHDDRLNNDEYEREADELAEEALIPGVIWCDSAAKRERSSVAVRKLAEQLEIHPSIVAGRIRHESATYRLMNHLIGHGQVRKHFPDVYWGK